METYKRQLRMIRDSNRLSSLMGLYSLAIAEPNSTDAAIYKNLLLKYITDRTSLQKGDDRHAQFERTVATYLQQFIEFASDDTKKIDDFQRVFEFFSVFTYRSRSELMRLVEEIRYYRTTKDPLCLRFIVDLSKTIGYEMDSKID